MAVASYEAGTNCR